MIAAAGRSMDWLYTELYRPLRLLGSRPRTVEEYTCAIAQWRRFALTLPIDRIDSDTLARFGASLIDGRSPSTVNKIIRHILAMLRFAKGERLISRVPKWRKLPEPRRVPLAFTVEEFRGILRAAAAKEGMVASLHAAVHKFDPQPAVVVAWLENQLEQWN